MYKKIIFGVLSILVLGLAYYLISPLFRSSSLDEPIPENTTPEISNNNQEQLPNSNSADSKSVAEMAEKEGALREERAGRSPAIKSTSTDNKLHLK